MEIKINLPVFGAFWWSGTEVKASQVDHEIQQEICETWFRPLWSFSASNILITTEISAKEEPPSLLPYLLKRNYELEKLSCITCCWLMSIKFSVFFYHYYLSFILLLLFLSSELSVVGLLYHQMKGNGIIKAIFYIHFTFFSDKIDHARSQDIISTVRSELHHHSLRENIKM